MAPLDSTLGAAFLGGFAAAVLYGVTSVQAFLYFHDCKDSRLLKGMVMTLWILDTVHLAFTAHALYFYLITSFGNAAVLQAPTWAILVQVYLTCVSDVIVRGYFSHRVFVLYGRKQLSWVLVLAINAISFVVFGKYPKIFNQITRLTSRFFNGLVCGFGFASRSFILKTFAKMTAASPMLYTSLASAVAADTLIAVSLCTFLIRSRTGFKRTDSLLTTLMIFSINTGLFTSICAMATMISYAIWPERFIFLGFYLALSKLYVNSLLASLNARSTLRPERNRDTDLSMKYSGSTPITFPMMELSPSSVAKVC